jgi:hypothetical protein
MTQPPENGPARLELSAPARTQRRSKNLLRHGPYSKPLSSSILRYSQLLADRYASGLLSRFNCAGCGQPGIDPCGRNGKHEFLCGACADGGGICAG